MIVIERDLQSQEQVKCIGTKINTVLRKQTFMASETRSCSRCFRRALTAAARSALSFAALNHRI